MTKYPKRTLEDVRKLLRGDVSRIECFFLDYWYALPYTDGPEAVCLLERAAKRCKRLSLLLQYTESLSVRAAFGPGSQQVSEDTMTQLKTDAVLCWHTYLKARNDVQKRIDEWAPPR